VAGLVAQEGGLMWGPHRAAKR